MGVASRMVCMVLAVALLSAPGQTASAQTRLAPGHDEEAQRERRLHG